MNRLLLSMLLAAVIVAGAALPELVTAYDGGGAPAPVPVWTVEVVLAYIDPGSAGFIIVSVLGFLAAAGYTVRAYFSRLKALVFRGSQNDEANEGLDLEEDLEDDGGLQR